MNLPLSTDSKSSFKGKFIAIQACLIKQEKSHINNAILHLRKTTKKEHKTDFFKKKALKKKEKTQNPRLIETSKI